MKQTDQIRSGGSYLSQNDFRVHFGLGDAKRIDSLEIRWPSGTVDVLRNLSADQFYAVLEGKGIVPGEQIRPATATHRLMLSPVSDPAQRGALRNSERWRHLAHHIPWVEPVVLRVGQQQKTPPHFTTMLKLVRPRF